MPPARIPDQQPQAPPPGPAPLPRSALNPELSVIGTHLGRFLSVRGDTNRNRFLLSELEVGLQQAIYPGIRFDVFLSGDAAEELTVNVEEAYASFARLPGLPFGGILGQKRLSFGRINPQHAHAWLFADTPAAIAAFLGEEGLIGNGAGASYTFPTRSSLFLNLEVGAYQLVRHDHAEAESKATALRNIGRMARKTRQSEEAPAEMGAGIEGMFPMARLWASHPFGHGAELDIGTSHGYGKSGSADNIRIQALDITFRRFPRSYERIIAQAEWFRHERTDRLGGTGKHARDGYYVHLGYRPNQYYDYGIRYDNTRFPWPLDGSERSLSAIWMNRLSETTFIRAQLKHGDRAGDSLLPARKGFTEAWLQFIWAGGPHAPHPVQ